MEGHWDEIFGFLIVFVQAYAMYLCMQMYAFAKIYSKSWARAWIALLSIMILATVRRILVIAFGFGLWPLRNFPKMGRKLYNKFCYFWSMDSFLISIAQMVASIF